MIDKKFYFIFANFLIIILSYKDFNNNQNFILLVLSQFLAKQIFFKKANYSILLTKILLYKKYLKFKII